MSSIRWLFGALAWIAGIAVAVLAIGWWMAGRPSLQGTWRRAVAQARADSQEQTAPAVDRDRRWRESTGAYLALAPPASGTALIGPAAKDGDGYPKQYVDGPGLRTLLLTRQFAELDRILAAFQGHYEVDWHYERWLVEAAGALGAPQMENINILEEWRRHTPSWQPRLVQAVHWHAAAERRRGSKFANETAAEDFKRMQQALEVAHTEAEAALAANPRLVAAHLEAMAIAGLAGEAERHQAVLARALQRCPNSFLIRFAQIRGLTPRWGGTYEAMAQAAKAAPVQTNPAMRYLPGLIDLDKASLLLDQGEAAAAAKAVERAFALGEYSHFYDQRSLIRMELADYRGAVADARKAVELRPGYSASHRRLAQALLAAGDPQAAVAPARQALLLDPTDETAKRTVWRIAQALAVQAHREIGEGRRKQALDLMDRAIALNQADPQLVSQRTAMILESSAPLAPPATAPDDLRQMQQIDYQLAKEAKWQEIVRLWTDYLSRHPRDARAYFERGGTYQHMNRPKESLSDTIKACELGLDEACLWARRKGAR